MKKKKAKWLFFSKTPWTAFWTKGPHIRLKVLVLLFFTLIAAMYLTIIMNRSSKKQAYKLYVNFICKFNFQVIITGNYASNLQQTLYACISETNASSSPILFNTALDTPAIIWSARTYNFQSIPLTICHKEYSYFCSKQIKESINGISVHLWSVSLITQRF